MRIVIDWDLCIGSGLCVASDPRAFRLVPFGRELRAVLNDPTVDDMVLLEAARVCPTLAIRLTGNDSRPVYPHIP